MVMTIRTVPLNADEFRSCLNAAVAQDGVCAPGESGGHLTLHMSRLQSLAAYTINPLMGIQISKPAESLNPDLVLNQIRSLRDILAVEVGAWDMECNPFGVIYDPVEDSAIHTKVGYDVFSATMSISIGNAFPGYGDPERHQQQFVEIIETCDLSDQLCCVVSDRQCILEPASPEVLMMPRKEIAQNRDVLNGGNRSRQSRDGLAGGVAGDGLDEVVEQRLALLTAGLANAPEAFEPL